MLNNILIASDFSEHANFALQRAIQLANKHHSSLYFVHVLNQSWMANLTQHSQKETPMRLLKVKEESEEKLFNLLKANDCKLPYQVSVLAGRAADEILTHARDNNCGLIIVGAHGQYYINDYVLGTTSGALVRQGHKPVLMIKKAPDLPYKRILMATDFSSASKEALEFVYSCFPDATFQLLHVVDIYYRKFFEKQELTFSSSEVNDIWYKLEDFLNSCSVNSKRFETKIIGGYTADAIVMQSEKWKADLLAFGTQGHSKLHYLLVGSVAKRILHLSNIDMLAAPSFPS